MIKCFDLHVVSDKLPAQLDGTLQKLGYKHRRFVGGDSLVRMKYLLSQKLFSRAEADHVYYQTLYAVERHPSFNGYIEEEAVAHDLLFSGNTGYKTRGPFPLTLVVRDCPQGSYKKCDIHITTTTRDFEVIQRLREAGFYYQSFEKPTLGQVHVTTVQSENMRLGKRLWKQVVQYLNQDAEFCGYVKFEVAIRINNFNFRLPPLVIDNEP